MRISDWSSDVCSSDLDSVGLVAVVAMARTEAQPSVVDQPEEQRHEVKMGRDLGPGRAAVLERDRFEDPVDDPDRAEVEAGRSEESRVGKACVGTCSYRWSPYHKKKKRRETNEE